MTDTEKLDLILTELLGAKDDIQELKGDVQDMKADIDILKHKVSAVELHLENCTDKNIQLLAENFIVLTNKLNQAVPAADKNLAYEVKVNYLIKEVEQLKQNVLAIIDRTA